MRACDSSASRAEGAISKYLSSSRTASAARPLVSAQFARLKVADGLLTNVSREFVAELQVNGTFAEYNQQTIISAGQPADNVFCVIAGRVKISRRNDSFGKMHVTTLGPGQWWGEKLWTMVPAVAITAGFLKTFKDYPPSQESGTLTVSKAVAMISHGSTGGGK